jgi:hypothetical protein
MMSETRGQTIHEVDGSVTVYNDRDEQEPPGWYLHLDVFPGPRYVITSDGAIGKGVTIEATIEGARECLNDYLTSISSVINGREDGL